MSLSAVRRAANVLNLSTPFGLLVARLGGAEVTVDDEGVFWAEGYRLPFPVAGAFTVGNVVITGSRLDQLSPEVCAHEVRHTWQWMLCGTLFLPLYTVAMAWSWALTGDRAACNLFERAAGLDSGGYHPYPVRRPLLRALARVRRAVRVRPRRVAG
ncbi:MAG: hypothetical protein Q4G45_03580 [Actinomycetia bacterium]|nr:hypothetical protein [Actinomycetes bacterium]